MTKRSTATFPRSSNSIPGARRSWRMLKPITAARKTISSTCLSICPNWSSRKFTVRADTACWLGHLQPKSRLKRSAPSSNRTRRTISRSRHSRFRRARRCAMGWLPRAIPIFGGIMMDLKRLKADFGSRLLFNGALDSHHVLIGGTPEAVRTRFPWKNPLPFPRRTALAYSWGMTLVHTCPCVAAPTFRMPRTTVPRR